MIGRTISHYKILEKIGSGGMGEVWKAEDLKLGRNVALKFLGAHIAASEDARRRFEREAQAAAQIDHPNICTVFDIDEVLGETFIVMPLLSAGTLQDRIGKGPLPVEQALELARQMASGLAAAHREGIVHRDIKPSNLMPAETEGGLQIKIVDFGLAQFRDRSALTREGSTVGTIAYMSPEQIEGKAVDERSDVWALGVVLHEMLTGRRPFDGGVDQIVVYSVLNEDPVPVEELRPDVPEQVRQLVNRALRKDPAERLPSAAAFLEQLTRRPTPQSDEPPPKLTSRLVPAAALLIAVLGAVWFFGGGEPPDRSAVLLDMQTLLAEGKTFEAYLAGREVQGERAEDEEFTEIWNRISRQATIDSDPSGALISIRPYGEFAAEWVKIGRTPLENLVLPGMRVQVRAELEGYRVVEVAPLRQDLSIAVSLTPNDQEDTGIVQVEAQTLEILRVFGIDGPRCWRAACDPETGTLDTPGCARGPVDRAAA